MRLSLNGDPVTHRVARTCYSCERRPAKRDGQCSKCRRAELRELRELYDAGADDDALPSAPVWRTLSA